MSAASKPDTILAPATPPGVGALALLRLSGPAARTFTEQLLEAPLDWQPRVAQHVWLAREGKRLDDVLLTWFQAPNSFTGEDIVEISCHGNPLIVRNITAAYLALGARMAGPGEFTQRAFLNGRLDLTQAEAVADVISAATDDALAGAQAMLSGRLGQAMQELRSELIDVLAHLEAHVDFPDEDISPQTGAAFRTRVQKACEQITTLADTAPLGRILREGFSAALVGAPNVGKSSLLNALLRHDRAIVSPHPGTTRDTIEAEANLGGVRVRLIDTAGQRDSGDAIEAEGIRRARATAAAADLLIEVVEAHLPSPASLSEAPTSSESQRRIRVANKADLGVAEGHGGALRTSTTTGEGLAELERAIAEAAWGANPRPQEGWLTVNARQEAALRRALAALGQAETSLAAKAPPELVAIDLRAALEALGDVVGATTNEDILDALFKNFCIGK